MLLGSKTLGITSEGFGELFESDFADTCVEKILMMLMGFLAPWLRTFDGVAHPCPGDDMTE